MFRITIYAYNWTKDDSELIDFENCSFDDNLLEIKNSCKIYRTGDKIKAIDDKESLSNNKNELDETNKLFQIKLKDNKYYYIPNHKEEYKNFTSTENFSWLIYKGNKFPLYKNKYKIREGDIIKLGRVWLVIKLIHLHKKNSEIKNLVGGGENKDLITYHSQPNRSLILNNDFQRNEKVKNLIDYYNDSDMDNNNTNNDKVEAQVPKAKLKKGSKKKFCRICYMEEKDPNLDPLLKPCKCSGSVKYIHYKCLLHWLKSKIEVPKSEYVENDYYTLYYSQKVECELCKEPIPHVINHKKKLYNIMDLERISNKNSTKNQNNPTIKKMHSSKVNLTEIDKQQHLITEKDELKNYIILDTIAYENKSQAFLYIAKFDKNNILTIGRGLEMNLIMNDLTISRSHCQLEIKENGDVYLTDNNSKFGTLVLVQAKELEIFRGQTLSVQAGRSYFDINCANSESFFSCCTADEVTMDTTYEKINYKAVKFEKHFDILVESDDSDKEDINSNYDDIIKKINNKKIHMIKITGSKKIIDQEQTNMKTISQYIVDNNKNNNLRSIDLVGNNPDKKENESKDLNNEEIIEIDSKDNNCKEENQEQKKV